MRAADCDTDHYLVVTEVRERLSVSKQAAQKLDGERFNLKKLNKLQFRKQYRIEITNRVTALENLSGGENINGAWENIKENIKTSAKKSLVLHELKLHKPWLEGECLGILDQRKHAKMQRVQDQSQDTVNHLNSVRREPSRHFRNKKKKHT